MFRLIWRHATEWRGRLAWEAEGACEQGSAADES